MKFQINTLYPNLIKNNQNSQTHSSNPNVITFFPFLLISAPPYPFLSFRKSGKRKKGKERWDRRKRREKGRREREGDGAIAVPSEGRFERASTELREQRSRAAAAPCLANHCRVVSIAVLAGSCHSHCPCREVRRRCCSCQRRRPWVRQRREIREEGRIGTCPATAHSCRSYRRPSSSNPPPPKLLAATSDCASTAGERCCHRKPPLKPVYVGNCRQNPYLLGLDSGICASKLRLLLNHRSFGECRSCRLIGSEGHCCFVSRGTR
ncbi:uncharacterized protein LOC110271462 [Arachis ipaensis]|uniref:uncharacterized protein LOC110271462 n=1 Tax=Arachis ipaensis TaxID=130454 RepID=UPI000A2B5ED3|nr:uncharacterized protein LOC110271462 [Arachis ipaensis]XP_025647436.1 uncharacterized protein LOC112742414 [Arachis hypogaea]